MIERKFKKHKHPFKIMEKKRRSVISLLVVMFLFSLFFLSLRVNAKSEMITIKFHSAGDGKNVTIDLSKYLIPSVKYVHSKVENVTIIMRGHFATIIPKPNWIGSEVITFSANESIIEDIEEGIIESKEITNLEPVIEMSFPQAKRFVVSPGKLEFSVIAYDPNNDIITVEWLINGKVLKKETGKGGIVSHFIFNETESKRFGSILKGKIFSENISYYVINSIVNDSKNRKMLEWRFNIVNETCTDFWVCSNWSDCINGKRYRSCRKINPECELTSNKPATEWIDPSCVTSIKDCKPKWTCTDWGECKIDYDVELITQGSIVNAIKTKQERLCYDAAYCTGIVGVETRECEKKIPIITRETKWCGQDYIEIFNSETGRFLSRIKKYKLGKSEGLDIELTLRELKREDYCWYCYDGIKDYDETGVDCGGSCQECIETQISFDFTEFFKFLLFIIADVALLLYIIFYIRRK